MVETILPNGEVTPCSAVRKISVMGAGYVGTTMAAVLAYQNPSCQVRAVDVNSERIAGWNSLDLPIFEPGLKELLSEVLDGKTSFLDSEYARSSLPRQHSNGAGTNGVENGTNPQNPNLTFSTDIPSAIAESDAVFICVDTPPLVNTSNTDGFEIDMRRHDSALKMVAENSTGHTIVLEKCTVPCGTTQRSQDFLAKYASPTVSFTVFSNPEYIAQGTAIYDQLYPDRVVIGSVEGDSASEIASEAISAIFTPWVPPNRVIKMSSFSSELAKLAHNAFLAQRVSSVNSVSAICEAGGGDIGDVTRAIGMSKRIGSKYLQATYGFGGSCLLKDTASLARLAKGYNLTESADYWSQVLVINEYQKAHFADRIITRVARLGNQLRGERIAVLGFAYKRETRDARGTPAREVVLKLLDAGASVLIYDPYLPPFQIQQQLRDPSLDSPTPDSSLDKLRISRSAYDACDKAKAVVILNDLPEFDNKETRSSPEKVTSTDENGTRVKRAKTRPTEPELRIDWARIAKNMHRPCYLFDGKCALDTKLLEMQGFIVEQIGR